MEIALTILGGWLLVLLGFRAGLKVGKTEMLREELEYGEKLRKQLEADLTPEERDLLDRERHES